MLRFIVFMVSKLATAVFGWPANPGLLSPEARVFFFEVIMRQVEFVQYKDSRKRKASGYWRVVGFNGCSRRLSYSAAAVLGYLMTSPYRLTSRQVGESLYHKTSSMAKYRSCTPRGALVRRWADKVLRRLEQKNLVRSVYILNRRRWTADSYDSDLMRKGRCSHGQS